MSEAGDEEIQSVDFQLTKDSMLTKLKPSESKQSQPAASIEPTFNHDATYDLANKLARNMIAFVDAMVQRGAVKGEELSSIGNMRDGCIQMCQVCENYEAHKDMEES